LAQGSDVVGIEAQGGQAPVAVANEVEANVVLGPLQARRQQPLQAAWRRARRRCRQGGRRRRQG
jgi:hypothetical protein